MKCQSVILMMLVTLIASSSCNTSDGSFNWNEVLDAKFETIDDQDSDLSDSTGLLENFNRVGSKNIISTVFNTVLKQVIPMLNNISIPSLSLGPNVGSFSDVFVQIVNATAYDVEGTGSFSVKNLTLTIDEITLTGQYDIKSLTLPGPIEIFGKGDVYISLQEIKFTTGLTIKLVVSNLTITDFPDFNLSLKNSTLNFENLMGGGPVGDLLNSIISDVLPQLIEAAQGELIANYGDEIANVLNPLINCMKSNVLNPLVCLKPKN